MTTPLTSIRTALATQFNSIPGVIPSVSIVAITPGDIAIFNTGAVAHGLITGIYVVIDGITGGTPTVNDNYIVSVIDSYNFSLQDTATTSPISVTIAGSGGSVSANLTSWPNAMFECVVGVPYVRVDWIDAASSEPTQGGGFVIKLGCMQITLVYPSGIGSGACLARAELIMSFFKKGMSFQQAGLNIIIHKDPQLDSGDFGASSTDKYIQIVRIYHSTQYYS